MTAFCSSVSNFQIAFGIALTSLLSSTSGAHNEWLGALAAYRLSWVCRDAMPMGAEQARRRPPTKQVHVGFVGFNRSHGYFASHPVRANRDFDGAELRSYIDQTKADN